MVSDGMGPASLSLTRSFRQYTRGLPINDTLVLDHHLVGSSRTRSDSSLVTDSAAGATAFSCGYKSYNGAISMLPSHSPCGTVLEAAKAAGYITGLITTTRLTDATPACFASHVNYRGEESLIALQEIGEHPLGRVVDLLIGGGGCFFKPNTTTGSRRTDDIDLISLAQKKHGWNFISNKQDFDKLENGTIQLPLLALLADEDIPFEIDRNEEEHPSLVQMTRIGLRALEAASRDSKKGFFLMVEGARIDHAGHGNDPAAQVHEVIAYDKAFSEVLDFIENSQDESILVATSDHDTGGLSVARQLHPSYPDYLWYPEVLANVSHSSEHLARKLYKYIDEHGRNDGMRSFVEQLVQSGLGIFDATDAELDDLVLGSGPISYILADMVSRRAQLGWSTHGHSAVDVNIYGSESVHTLRGNHENTDVGRFLSQYLHVDVDAITEQLRGKDGGDMSTKWFGSLAINDGKAAGTLSHLHHVMQPS